MAIPQQDRKILSARISPVLETVHDWRHKPQEGLTKARAVARVLNHQHWNLVEGPSCHTLKPARSDDRPRGLKKVDLLQPSLSGSKPKPHGWRQTQKKRGRKELLVINSDEGYEGLIDGDVVSLTRKAPKIPETSRNRPEDTIRPRRCRTALAQATERPKAVRAAKWLESKVRCVHWTRKRGLSKAVAFDRKIASLAMNGATVLDNVRCILASYITWCEDNADMIEGDCLKEPSKSTLSPNSSPICSRAAGDQTARVRADLQDSESLRCLLLRIPS